MRLIDRRVRILSLGRKVREAKQRAFNAERRKTKYPPPPTPEKIANVLDSMMDPAMQIQNAIPGPCIDRMMELTARFAARV
jgi:hypothetical protein